jgi:hypothetical protein
LWHDGQQLTFLIDQLKPTVGSDRIISGDANTNFDQIQFGLACPGNEAIRTALILPAFGGSSRELMKYPAERLPLDLLVARRRPDHDEVLRFEASERPQIHEAKRITPTGLSTKAVPPPF